jgi:hypothetical protein
MSLVRDYPQMKIRLSPKLKALIEESAKANNRTLNAEMLLRLEASFKNEVENAISNGLTEERVREIVEEAIDDRLRRMEQRNNRIEDENLVPIDDII